MTQTIVPYSPLIEARIVPFAISKKGAVTLTAVSTFAILFFSGFFSPRWNETRLEQVGRLLMNIPPIRRAIQKKIEISFRSFQESNRKNWAIFGDPITEIPEKGWSLKEAIQFIEKIDKVLLEKLKGIQFSGAIYSQSLLKGSQKSLLKEPDHTLDEPATSDAEFFEKLSEKNRYAFTLAFEKSYLWNVLHHDEFPIGSWLEYSMGQCVAQFLNFKKDLMSALFTAGGSLSIDAAIRGYRNWGQRVRGQSPGQGAILLTNNAHAAFFKAADYYSLRVVLVDTDKEGRMSLSSLREKLYEEGTNALVVIGSAPTYAKGRVDPLDEMGKIAKSHNTFFHVDHCLGAFATKIKIPKTADTVTVDTHKYGNGAKGGSLLLMKNFFTDFLTFVIPEWSGGVYGTRNTAGSESAANFFTSFLALMLEGMEGYNKTEALIASKRDAVAEIFRKFYGKIEITNIPDTVLVAFSIDTMWGLKKNATAAFLDFLKEEGFKLNLLADDLAHFCITPRAASLPDFLQTLEVAIKNALDKLEKKNQELTVSGEEFPGSARMYGALNAALSPNFDKGPLDYFLNILFGKYAARETVRAFFRAQAQPYAVRKG